MTVHGRRGGAIFASLGGVALLAACVGGGAPVAPPPVSQPKPAPQPACMADTQRRAAFMLSGVAVQGGMMRGVAPGCATKVMLDGAPVAVMPDGHFLIAFDRDSAASVVLSADIEGGPSVRQTIMVQPGNWRLERVNASPTGGVPSAQYLARRKPELERIAAARSQVVDSDGWRQKFRWPVTGRISGLFGAQRIYRGTPGSYHTGVDVAASTGTPFVAPADGVVVLAAQTPFTLEGHLLILSHGVGLSSAFLHCSSLSVKEGDVVRQGQILGAVGATGRASGPHMHWGMTWNGARLDPQKIAEQMSPQ